MARAYERSVAITFAALDLLVAAAYVIVFFYVVPSRSSWISVLAGFGAAVMAAGGVGMLVPHRWGRVVAAGSSILMLAACVMLIATITMSVAYLHGIYGGVGQAGTVIGVVAAALTVELVGLLPALQLAHLWRGRRPGAT